MFDHCGAVGQRIEYKYVTQDYFFSETQYTHIFICMITHLYEHMYTYPIFMSIFLSLLAPIKE
jgi:hypothetical protein